MLNKIKGLKLAVLQVKNFARDFFKYNAVPFVKDANYRRQTITGWRLQKRGDVAASRADEVAQKHFINAVKKSGLDQLSLNTVKDFDRYERAHKTFYNPVLKLWRSAIRQNPFMRIISLAGPIWAANFLLPVVIPVLVVGIIATRLINKWQQGNLIRLSENLRHEKLNAPLNFHHTNGQLAHPLTKQPLQDGFMLEAPVNNAGQPTWTVKFYNADKSAFSDAVHISAATYEALATGVAKVQDFKLTETSLREDAAKATLMVLCPDKAANEINNVLKGWWSCKTDVLRTDKMTTIGKKFGRIPPKGDLTKAAYAEAVLFALSPFMRGASTDEYGLSDLAGQIKMSDVNDLIKQRATGRGLDASQAIQACDIMTDLRYQAVKGHSFNAAVKMTVELTQAQKSFVDMLVKDSAYNSLFNMDQMMKLAKNEDGQTSLVMEIAGNDYARQMTGDQILDLIQPENRIWAMDYLDMMNDDQTRRAVVNLLLDGKHDMLKKIAMAHGAVAGEVAQKFYAAAINMPKSQEKAATPNCPTASQLFKV